MKEIHAYRNEDGTYRVELISKVEYGTINIDGYIYGETTESKSEVPRARVHIDALHPLIEVGETPTLTIGAEGYEETL